MLPKIKQYKKWSLPSKYSFWSFILGIPALAIAIYTLFPKNNILEQVAQEEYAPKVSLTDAKSMQWLGDSKPFLTLYFKNDSKGPAKNLKVNIYDGNKKLAAKKLSQSNLLPSGHLALKPGQDLGIPLIMVREIKEDLSKEVKNNKILGFGLSSSVPEAIRNSLNKRNIKDGLGYYSFESYPLVVKLSYEGITNTKYNVAAGFYVYLNTTKHG